MIPTVQNVLERDYSLLGRLALADLLDEQGSHQEALVVREVIREIADRGWRPLEYTLRRSDQWYWYSDSRTCTSMLCLQDAGVDVSVGRLPDFVFNRILRQTDGESHPTLHPSKWYAGKSYISQEKAQQALFNALLDFKRGR